MYNNKNHSNFYNWNNNWNKNVIKQLWIIIIGHVFFFAASKTISIIRKEFDCINKIGYDISMQKVLNSVSSNQSI